MGEKYGSAVIRPEAPLSPERRLSMRLDPAAKPDIRLSQNPAMERQRVTSAV